MPISSKAFDSCPDSVNPKLFNLLSSHKDKAYSRTELERQFGKTTFAQLIYLFLDDKIEMKNIKDETYFRWKSK